MFYGYLDKLVMIYLDDVFIYIKTLAEYIEHII